jgi:hypothetical protein
MRMISLRRLLSKLTVLALSASAAAAGATPDAPDVRSRDARRCDDCDDLDDDAPIDREQVDEHDAALVLGRSLAKALSEMRELDAIQLSTTWALSQDPMRRAGLAHALEWPFRLMPDRVILEHLSQDPDPAIREACHRAAWIRGIGPEWRA